MYISKKVLLIIGSGIMLMLFLGTGLFFLKDMVMPYTGEILGVGAVYHKEGCSMLKYSDKKDISLYQSYYKAIWSGLRPCNSCKPPYFSKDEEKRYQQAQDSIKAKAAAKTAAEEKKKQELNAKVMKIVEVKYAKKLKEELPKWEVENRNASDFNKDQGFFWHKYRLKRSIEQEVRAELDAY